MGVNIDSKSGLQESSISVDNGSGTKAIQDQVPNQEKKIDVTHVESWSDHITDSLRQKLVLVGVPMPEVMLQIIKDTPNEGNSNSFSEVFMYSSSANNREKYYRDWLVWSK